MRQPQQVVSVCHVLLEYLLQCLKSPLFGRNYDEERHDLDASRILLPVSCDCINIRIDIGDKLEYAQTGRGVCKSKDLVQTSVVETDSRDLKVRMSIKEE